MKCEYDPKVCNACNQELRLKACGGCNIAKYCSRYCQMEDWSVRHRQDCLSIWQLQMKICQKDSPKCKVDVIMVETQQIWGVFLQSNCLETCYESVMQECNFVQMLTECKWHHRDAMFNCCSVL